MMNKNDLSHQIRELVANLENQVRDWRRHFHMHPELSNGENKTSQFIYNTLQQMDLEPATIGETGIIATLQGEKGPGPTIGLRADMDALPILEEAEVDFVSVNQGIMHACGHDAHLAIMLGTAKALSLLKHYFAGQVRFIFQPCEEMPPGGAAQMIQAGILENPSVDNIFALHVNPNLPAGTIGLKEGVIMAAADIFTLRVIGSGGHGAAPQQTIDPIVIAAQIISSLQTVVSRYTDPTQSAVVSIGQIAGGTAHNIIPNEVFLKGTCRSLTEESRKKIHSLVEQLISHTTKAFGADYELDYQYGYPPVINNPELIKMIKEVCIDSFGENNTIELVSPFMGGEDFAYFTQRCPGAFIHLGVGAPNTPNYPLHHPKFSIDESALAIGMELMIKIALKSLRRG